jgi:hypothetical protein
MYLLEVMRAFSFRRASGYDCFVAKKLGKKATLRER